MKSWVLVMTPLKLEFEALTDFLQSKEATATTETFGPLKVRFFSRLGLACAVGGHGKTQFALQTQFLVDRIPNIKGLVCLGVAGSLAELVHPQDVVIADKTVEHDFQMKFIKQPLPSFSGHQEHLEKLRDLSGHEFKVHVGPIASGDEDILELARAKELAALTGAIAVAWEGAGGARVAGFNKIPYLEIRGITDRADQSTIQDFKVNLRAALQNAAAVLVQIRG